MFQPFPLLVSRVRPGWIGFRCWVIAGCLAGCLAQGKIPSIEAVRELIRKGDYDAGLKACRDAVRESEPGEEYRVILVETLLYTGGYPEALQVLTNAMARYPRNIRLRLVGQDVMRFNGKPERAAELMDEINELGGSRMWAYRDPLNLVTLGRAAARMGADPKVVLENFFEPAKRSEPGMRDPHLAIGELALAKGDYELAARTYAEAQQRVKDDPDVLCGLARAYGPSERGKAMEALEEALEINPRHTPSLIEQLDYMVDAEEYEEGDKLVGKVLEVNPRHPVAWAYRAVLRHLANDTSGEASARGKALAHWASNPEVDHLIGTKLSQKYRFKEGAASQRLALAMDPKHLRSRLQLAQDLLRLGEVEEGWKLAQEVHAEDGYDVTAFNLTTLRETMDKFALLTNAHFKIRMESREAQLFGPRVLELLERAHTKLTERYGVQLPVVTTVEIFHRQGDFAVRTFGMPGNPGYLGVCFGSTITANSPSTQRGSPVNWEAVLWHEFCHTITLTLTRNRMPRWLSEGISVFEERQQDLSWGQGMKPQYREMILGEDLTPVSKLSRAFLAPKSAGHLQFAYYESSLVVEFLVQRFGLPTLRQVLVDLGEGVEINDSLAKRTLPMAELDKQFEQFAKQKAEAFGPGYDWERPKRGRLVAEADQVVNSKNIWTILQQAARDLGGADAAKGEATLKGILSDCPDFVTSDGPHSMLAEYYRKQKRRADEQAVLGRWLALDGSSLEACTRLLEMAAEDKDWARVVAMAEKYLAIDPLRELPYQLRAHARGQLGDAKGAVADLRTLLLLEPQDLPAIHFQLAQLLHGLRDGSARRHVLEALEHAPRYRDAQRLLMEIEAKEGT